MTELLDVVVENPMELIIGAENLSKAIDFTKAPWDRIRLVAHEIEDTFADWADIYKKGKISAASFDNSFIPPTQAPGV